ARRIVQLLAFIFFSAAAFELVGALPVLLPVMWTWGLKPNVIGDAFSAIQFGFYEAAFPWLAFASFLIVGVLIGKAMCGWVCPFGFIQDLVGFVKRRKNDFSIRTHETLIYGKYIVLAIALFISGTFAVTKAMGISGSYERSLGVFTKAPFTTLSPAEMLFATLPNKTLEFYVNVSAKPFIDVLAGIGNLSALFWTQLLILILVLGFVAFIPRGWCKYFCPHGAIMAILNKFSFIGLKRDPVKCAKGGCRLCVQACPMRVPILDLPWEKFNHPECVYCMKCVDACKDKALKLKYP
ncbi:MAG: 4Fe-4S binding protein, partial [Candidatus Bathyarchaeia archaeon]